MYGKPEPKPKFATTKLSTAAQVSSSTSVAQTTSESHSSEEGKDQCGLSDAQYNQIVQRIQSTMHFNPLSHATSGDTQAFWPGNSSVNSVQFAGTFQHIIHSISHVSSNLSQQ